MSRTIAIVNSQSKVGKTTTALGLARALARNKYKVLLIDDDPLSTLYMQLGYTPHASHTLEACLTGEQQPADCIIAVGADIDIMPCTIHLVQFEIDAMKCGTDRDSRLRQCIDRLLHGEGTNPSYDFVVIDTPASLGLLTVNALAAADEVIIPIRCDYFASEGLAAMLSLIDKVRHTHRPQLELRGMLITHVDTTSRAWRRNLDEMLKVYGDTVIPQPIVEGEGMDECYRQLATKLY